MQQVIVVGGSPGLGQNCISLLDLVDDIAQYSTCGRQLASAAAVEHGLVDTVAPYHYSIEYTVDVGQQAGLKRNQHRHDGRQNLPSSRRFTAPISLTAQPKDWAS